MIADRGGSDRSGRERWGQATPFWFVQVQGLQLHSGLRIWGGEVLATCSACVWESVRVATDVFTAMTHVFPAMTDVFPADTSTKRTAR